MSLSVTRALPKVLAILVGALLVTILLAPAGSAAKRPRALTVGSEGPEVADLQMRVAGWYPNANQKQLRLSGTYNRRTRKAVKAFQRHYKLTVDGVAGAEVMGVLARLEDEDGSTKHFEWDEFDQNYNARCSKKANKYAGTFQGGKVPRAEVRANVQRLMWRLEALRAKGGGRPIGINSGFRSVAYNECIGGARLSQHLYGTAADMRVVGRTNDATREDARAGQFHGIACYSSFTHNHLDLRLENPSLPEGNYWWWPDVDSRGRELAEDGRPCWGETASQRAVASNLLRAIRAGDAGAGSVVPNHEEVTAFEAAGEPFLNGQAD